MKPIVLILAAISLSPALAQAQASPPDKPLNSKSADTVRPDLQDVKTNTSAAAGRLTLKDAGPLSPEDAARITAKSLAKKNSLTGDPVNEKQDQGRGLVNDKSGSNGAVVEFRPAANGSENNSNSAVVVQKQSKAPLKHVHGELYGAKSGIGHADGGSVGATSKSGKTSVYIESDQSRSSALQPQ